MSAFHGALLWGNSHVTAQTTSVQGAPPGGRPEPGAGDKPLPDTPAAKVLAEMLQVLNGKDLATIKEFVRDHYAAFWFEAGHTVDSLASGLLQRAEECGGGLHVVGFKVQGALLIGAKVRSASGALYSFSINTTQEQSDRIGMLMIAPTGSDSAHGPAGDVEEFGKRLDQFVSDLVEHDHFSGAILVTQDGKPIYRRAAGEASKSFAVSNKIDTKFNLASVNKMFTAVAIAQLAERGKLSFTDPVGKYLPDYPNPDVREKVTIHHLLTHTSGMGGDILSEEWFNSSRLFDRTVSDRMRYFAEEPMIFEPGSRMRYCNAGFHLLGRIVEVVSGMDYYDYIRKNIYEPAGMKDTDSFQADEVVPNKAVGYTHNRYGDGAYYRKDLPEADAKAWYATTFLGSMRGGPAGGGYSTVEDLDRFIQALTAGKLVSPQMFTLLTSPKTEMSGNPDGKTDYGYGFMIVTTSRGQVYFGHGGTFWGVSAELHRYPKEGYTVAVLSNYDMAARTVASKIDGLLP